MSVNIFLFVPNLIGYARVILAIASLFYMSNSPYTAMILYWLSAFLDAFDGMAARALNQGYYGTVAHTKFTDEMRCHLISVNQLFLKII